MAISDSETWQSLKSLAPETKSVGEKTTSREWRVEAAGLTIDLSRQPIGDKALNLLYELAANAGLPEKIDQLLSGETVNTTENRAAHHSALRLPPSSVNGEVQSTLEKIRALSIQLRDGEWLGATGKVISDVVNIGIGGSDLGPRMACEALSAFTADSPRVHFVANIDPRDLELTLRDLAPETTLFIVSSKSFGTLETLENALSARAWLLNGDNSKSGIGESALHRHVIAVSSNVEKAAEFGIAAENILPMWDWVGGRYSLWSAIGLPIAVAAGFDQFRGLLDGAHAMDKHFASAPTSENAPALLALLEIWHVNFCAAQSVAVLPYSLGP